MRTTAEATTSALHATSLGAPSQIAGLPAGLAAAVDDPAKASSPGLFELVEHPDTTRKPTTIIVCKCVLTCPRLCRETTEWACEPDRGSVRLLLPRIGLGLIAAIGDRAGAPDSCVPR